MNKIILTIDTEGPRGTNPILYQIWGKISETEMYGIPKIIEICNQYNIKGLFFVDIAEMWDYGREKIAEVVKYIIKEGHDVGVHIHPHHKKGEIRHFLFDYTKEEQRSIIAECTDEFVKITGVMPKSFRAGKYGANKDTLDILCELGYEYDFSEFYSNKWCGIKPEIAYVLPVQYKTLIEFPVTIYQSLKLGNLYNRYDKLEVTENTSELLYVIKEYAKKKEDGLIILFMHSFSLLDYLTHPDTPTLNNRNLERFQKLLYELSRNKQYKFISETNLKEIPSSEVDSVANVVTTRGAVRQLWFTLTRAYAIRKTNKKAKILFLIIEVIAAILVVGGLICLN